MTSFVLFVPMRFIYLLFWYVILIWILLFERSFVQQYIIFWWYPAITNLLEVHDFSKIILYSNSCLKSEKNHEGMVSWLNESGFHSDFILVTGQLRSNNQPTIY
jgi:hypothetical protein